MKSLLINFHNTKQDLITTLHLPDGMEMDHLMTKFKEMMVSANILNRGYPKTWEEVAGKMIGTLLREIEGILIVEPESIEVSGHVDIFPTTDHRTNMGHVDKYLSAVIMAHNPREILYNGPIANYDCSVPSSIRIIPSVYTVSSERGFHEALVDFAKTKATCCKMDIGGLLELTNKEPEGYPCIVGFEDLIIEETLIIVNCHYENIIL